MNNKEVMQQALEALEHESDVSCDDAYRKERDALRAALAQPEQEPVLWMMPDGKIVDKWALQFYGGQAGEPLYNSPPQRKPLTEEQIYEILGYGAMAQYNSVPQYAIECVRAIERAHGIGG